ncbi:hypothetical protein CKO40_05975 [Halochromatium glycolicum]|uniref:DUF72 domain-containing protein n=2 Tax=Halochromatium glycolicum TaxID=85075 RepID=A0AAJ0X8Q3_9GAMM|nr:hypothetical protein [Halochromatium glycolicum]
MRPSGRKSLLDGADFIATQTLVQGSTSDRLSESERSHSETSPGTLPASILAATPSPDVRSLAQSLAHALENALYLGTSSWSFPGWSGLIYGQPSGKSNLSQQGLPAYAQHPLLRSVGVDSGFYAPLDSARLARWAAQVPPGFRFLVKAPALITDRFRRAAHGRPAGTNPSFLDAEHALDIAVGPFLEGLGDKAGVLLFQFPPVGRDGSTEPRRFAEALYRFLKRLPKGPTYAVELRDRPLLTPDLAAALHHGGAVPSLALHPRLPPLPTQLSLFDAYRADGPLVVRWLLRRNRRYAEARERYAPFDRLCEPDPIARHDLADAVIAALGERRPVFVIANNKAEGSAPLTLIELARQLADVRNHSA